VKTGWVTSGTSVALWPHGTFSTLGYQLTCHSLDRLILLLDTGTSTQLRNTAAKQLADIAKRAFDRQLDVEPDANPWPEALRLLSRIVPFLSSKSSDTRNAAAEAVGLIASALPPWDATTDAVPVNDFTTPFEGFSDIVGLITRAPKLLASAGQEYIVTKGSGKDAAKQKKAMMGSLGLAPGVGWGDDVDKVVDEESDDAVKKEEPTEVAAPTPPVAVEEPKDPYEGLSARQINMLKRKRKGGGTALEEANK
jgi:TATA-binding protein-associated factor